MRPLTREQRLALWRQPDPAPPQPPRHGGAFLYVALLFLAFVLALILSSPAHGAHCPPWGPTPPPPAAAEADDPLAGELARFPLRWVAEANWGLANAHWSWAAGEVAAAQAHAQLNADRPWWGQYVAYRTAYAQLANDRDNCWRWLALAHNPTHSVELRQSWLEELRGCLGDDDFAAGSMPPPLPCLGAPH